jgi:hypothetical protein
VADLGICESSRLIAYRSWGISVGGCFKEFFANCIAIHCSGNLWHFENIHFHMPFSLTFSPPFQQVPVYRCSTQGLMSWLLIDSWLVELMVVCILVFAFVQMCFCITYVSMSSSWVPPGGQDPGPPPFLCQGVCQVQGT